MTTADPPAKNKRRFFVMTPQLVWALARDPYDFMLWTVVKMAAWDTGECILSTRDLATLAMMSLGKVQDCRAYLLRMGLLEGEFRRDPGYPQPVYHLRVPDLWQRNQQLIDSGLGHSLKKRVAFKAAQRAVPALPSPLPAGQGILPNEQAVPPDEQGIPPGEQGIPPGETNKIKPETSQTLEGDSPPNPNTFQISHLPPQRGGLEGGRDPANSQPQVGSEPGFLPPPTSSRWEETLIRGSKIICPSYLKSITPNPPQGGTLPLVERPPSAEPPANPPNPPQGGTSDFSPPIGGPPSLSPPSGGPGGPPSLSPPSGGSGGPPSLSPPSGGPGGPLTDLHPLLLRLCRYEPEVVSGYRRKQLQEAVRRLQAHRVGPGDLAAFESWWYGHDWRGKRGEPPEPGAILDTWGRFKYQPQPQEVSYGRGYRFARPEEFGLA